MTPGDQKNIVLFFLALTETPLAAHHVANEVMSFCILVTESLKSLLAIYRIISSA